MIKKFIAFLTAAFLCLPALHPVSAEETLSVSARAAVLMDASTGRILFSVNPDEKLAMASTTKIMTALLALEEAEKENKAVKITREMIQVEGSSMGLKEGNVLSLKDLTAGLLAVSGNDAANSVAIAVSGSKQAFADRMNQKARELGMENTHFVTPSGLDDEEHYSTARDMAILACHALENEEFAAIVSQPTIRVTYQSPDQSYVLTNHNKLLRMYEGCIGVKTGFTKKAGRCLVSAAERDGVRLIAVTLNAPDDWNDHMAMFEYGFSQMSVFTPDESAYRLPIAVVGGEASSVSVRGETGEAVNLLKEEEDSLIRKVELPRFVYAGVEKGQIRGRVVYCLGEKKVASVPLRAENAVPYLHREKTAWEKIQEWFTGLFIHK